MENDVGLKSLWCGEYRITTYDHMRGEWKPITEQLERILPLRGRSLLCRVDDWRHRARMQLGFLVPSVSWLPYPWPEKGNGEFGNDWQSPMALFEVDEEDAPSWWPVFLADALTFLGRSLYTRALDIPDLYLRDAYEVYNGMIADLLVHPEITEGARQSLVSVYFVDPRFPNASFFPLLRSAVSDDIVIPVARRLEASIHSMEPFNRDKKRIRELSHMPWMDVRDRESRFGSMVGEWFSAEGMPLRPELASHWLANQLFREQYQTVFGLARICELYAEKGIEQALHDYVRYVITQSRYEWCSGLLVHERVAETEEAIRTILKRFTDDEIIGALSGLCRALVVRNSERKEMRKDVPPVICG